MFNKKFTTLHWIYLWVVVTLMFALLAEKTQNNWIFATTVISAAILVGGTLITAFKICHRKWILRHKPFVVLYDYSASCSKDKQYLLLAIKMKTKQVIEYFSLRFDGNGEKPIIITLHNCISGVILKDRPIPFLSNIDGNWCWENQPTFQQSDISLAVEFITTKQFDGFLKIDLKCDKVDRIIYEIPFKITDTKTHYNGFGERMDSF